MATSSSLLLRVFFVAVVLILFFNISYAEDHISAKALVHRASDADLE